MSSQWLVAMLVIASVVPTLAGQYTIDCSGCFIIKSAADHSALLQTIACCCVALIVAVQEIAMSTSALEPVHASSKVNTHLSNDIVSQICNHLMVVLPLCSHSDRRHCDRLSGDRSRMYRQYHWELGRGLKQLYPYVVAVCCCLSRYVVVTVVSAIRWSMSPVTLRCHKQFILYISNRCIHHRTDSSCHSSTRCSLNSNHSGSHRRTDAFDTPGKRPLKANFL